MAAAEEKVDVVIAGAGAAASVYAAVLAEAGKSVLVLESGPARSNADLYSSQIWARRLKWAAPHVADQGPHSIFFNLNAGRGYGGAAIHHYGIWLRYAEDDFELQTRYGRGLDWPIRYADLRPYYDRVQADVGIAGDHRQEPWLPPAAPYPLPPVKVFGQGAVLRRGFEAEGLNVSPLPMAVLTEPYKGRPACIWDGWCDAGCPIGALGNPLVHYIPRATAAGARLQADSHCARVLTDRSGRRATGVEYFDSAGEARVQPADAVVLAAFTGENVRILLNSRSSAHPDGLGNGAGLLGRYLMTHPSVYLFGMFEPETEPYMGATGGQLHNRDHHVKDRHAHAGAFGARHWEIGQALKPNDILGIAMGRAELFGPALTRFMHEAAQHVGVMASVAEDMPRRENRLELAEGGDRFGVPLVQSVYETSPEGVALHEEALAEGRRIMQAAGAREVWNGPMGGQHIMGGTIMGRKPSDSVVDRWSRVHECGNVMIGGPSVFPTASSANSTFTLQALALMAAEAAVRDWDGLAAGRRG